MIELLPDDSYRIGFLGACRSGKSWGCWLTVEELLDSGYRWALIHDVVRDPQYPPAEIVSRYPDKYPRACVTELRQAAGLLPNHRRLVFRHPVTAGEVAALAMSLRRHFPAEKVVVVFDELDAESINCRGQWADARVHDLYHHGRGIAILGCSQRLIGMPRGARGLHDVWFVFRLTAPEAAELAPYGVTDQQIEQIGRQARGQFTTVSLA